MATLITLWWLCFCTALGLCLGSFLNAVVYRLPRNHSLRNPLWSFCPSCKHRIQWYDNLPVLSFILLRGRCRHCGTHISVRYPIIEISMALIVLMLVDAFFIGRVRSGVSPNPFGLTDRFQNDWPILLAHITLFACLLPMSIIDLEYYWVDVRFTNFAIIMGFICHAVWMPKDSTTWPRPADPTAVMSLCAMLGLGIVWIIRSCQLTATSEEKENIGTLDDALPAVGSNPARPFSRSWPSQSHAGAWISGLILLAMLIALLLDETNHVELRHVGRALLPLVMFLGMILWESALRRPADSQILEAIHEERHEARRMVLHEFALLAPALVIAVIGGWIVSTNSELAGRVGGALRTWPLYGLATAASGYVIAGAIGWAIRIVFTLVFGKEAFGTGDIHLMAAAGCVAGWPVVVLGFFLTCGLAMASLIALLPCKRTRALPLGPWLSLSFLTVVVFYDSIIQWPLVTRTIQSVTILVTGHPPLP